MYWPKAGEPMATPGVPLKVLEPKEPIPLRPMDIPEAIQQEIQARMAAAPPGTWYEVSIGWNGWEYSVEVRPAPDLSNTPIDGHMR